MLRKTFRLKSPFRRRSPQAFLFAAFLLFFALPAVPPLLFAQETGADTVLRAYQYCFPDRVNGVSLRDDWTITVDGKIFYWEGGRLLPESARANRNDYRPRSFALYPETIPDPAALTPGQITGIRREELLESREGEDFHREFQSALYGGSTREEIERNLCRISFLGRQITVHRLVEESLERVDRAIRAAAETDSETARFLRGILSIGGYDWREIRGTRRMSYHAWGLAVDIQGAAARNLAVYWMWERAHNRDWMLVPVSRRWTPPAAVIRAFENEGFIWGGKWIFFDNMHFEFRPEIHEIRRILRAGGASATIRTENAVDLHHIFPQY